MDRDHQELTGYANKTAAVRVARTQSGQRVPYRVWHCPDCSHWHAAAWLDDDARIGVDRSHPGGPPAYLSHVESGDDRGSTWRNVGDLVTWLPDAVLGQAYGSPVYYVCRQPFAKLRWDERGREIVQLWSGNTDLPTIVADRRDTFPLIDTTRSLVSVWAYLDRLDPHQLADLLLESFRTRGGPRRAARVDHHAYFTQAGASIR